MKPLLLVLVALVLEACWPPNEAVLIPCPCAPPEAELWVVPEKSGRDHISCTKIAPDGTAEDIGSWSPILAQCAWPRH